MEVLVIAIQKGGTGNTTTAAALAQAAAYTGQRVLVIDLDPQGNLSFALGADQRAAPTSYEWITQGTAAPIQTTEQGLDIIPASAELALITLEKGSARRLQKVLEPLKGDYELIVIDTPPTAGALQYNALQAATGLIIPLQADIYNLQSFYQIMDTAHQIQQSNPALVVKGFVLTQYDSRSTLAKQFKQTITDNAAALGVPCLGIIRAGVAIKEAAALQKSLFDYAGKSKPAADYMALFNACQN